MPRRRLHDALPPSGQVTWKALLVGAMANPSALELSMPGTSPPANSATSMVPLISSGVPLNWSSAVVSALAAAVPGRERQAVDSHLDGLAALACPATLIANLDYRVFNRHGVILESADLMYGRPVPRTGLRWKWEIAPFGEERRHTRRVHYMAAWPDWRVAD